MRTIFTFLLTVAAVTALAQSNGLGRDYTAEHPLIYEDVRDLWPYAFLNEKGEATGYNIDLVRMLLDELHIPYEIRMTNTKDAFNDLKEGRSDLIMGLSVGFHDEYGHYSENSVTLFTQSIVSPKNRPTEVHTMHDLATHKVFVNEGSMVHHLMMHNGWDDNAIPTRDVAATLQKISTDEEGEMVWNTLSLRWLIRKYRLDNLVVQPVNMPHGEYKFMSNDDALLHRLDSMLTQLNATDRMTKLNNKWFYPDREKEDRPRWYWYIGAGGVAFLLVLLIYTLSYRLQAHRITQENNKRNRRLSLIMETTGVRVWTYDIVTQQFTWRNEFGQPAYVYTREEFVHRYTAEDLARLNDVLNHLSELPLGKNGEEEEITLHIKAQDAREDGDTELRDFIIALSVLRRDKYGKPTVLIGTKKDITKKTGKEREANERTLRYWSLFNTPMVGIMLFDKDGRLTNINQKACEMFGCVRDEIIAERPLFNHLFCIHISMSEANGFHATQMACFDEIPLSQRPVSSVKRTDKMYNEYRLVTVNDEAGELLGMFAFCTDVTYVVNSLEEETRSEQLLHELQEKEKKYVATIDDFIGNASVRVVSYSPLSHTFTIYRDSTQVQHTLAPIRVMTLVDERMRTKTMRIIGKMDNREPVEIDTDIRTSLRLRQGITLHVYVNLLPQTDQDGNVSEYLGVLRDISDLKATEQQLHLVEAKTQEVEDTKTTFIRNMMQEIRTPMDKVIEQAGHLSGESDGNSQSGVRQEIVKNAEKLTHVIDNILFLSRLEAHMVEIQRNPTDFSLLFEDACREGWSGQELSNVKCVIDNPYDKLVIDIDAEHIGNVIQQLTRNAAQHTHSGAIHTRYDYIGRRLMITVDDTGEGMAPGLLEQFNESYVSGVNTSTGMGLAICKELLRQMGGHLEINSEIGLGTTVWVTLPCQSTVVKRKKNL